MCVTLCFNAAAVLLQCTLCHPTCCSLTLSLYFSLFFLLLSFHSYFSFFLSAAHQISWKGGAMRGTWRLRLLPLHSANQERSRGFWKHRFFKNNPLFNTKEAAFEPICKQVNTTIQMHRNTDPSTKRWRKLDVCSHNAFRLDFSGE